MIEIVIHMKSLTKIRYKVATLKNAHEYARNTILYGAFDIEVDGDGRRHEIFWPPSAIEKIKILDVPENSISEKSGLNPV